MTDGTRRILAGLFWFLACLGVLLSAVAVWTYQSVLTTNGWVDLTSAMLDDPQVVAGTSETVSQRVATAVDLEERVASHLPGPSALLAPAISDRVEGIVADGIAAVMGTDAFDAVWVKANEIVHPRVMNALKGGGDVVSTDEGAIQLNVMPLVTSGIAKLQEMGLLPTDRRIPDLTSATPEEALAELEAALGRDLPDDLGQIVLVDSERLADVQTAVRNFELLMIGLVVATIVFALLAIWLSRRRLRMVLWLALGSIGALVLARLAARTAFNAVSGSLADGPGGTTVRGVLDTMSDRIMWFTSVIILIALVVALIAWIADRRSRPGVAERPPIRTWLRDHSTEILVGGAALIGFVALWRTAGPDVALPALVAVGALLAVVAFLRRGDDQEPEVSEPAIADQMSTQPPSTRAPGAGPAA